MIPDGWKHVLSGISFGFQQDYLEIKRMIFPRFYFLSNAELLDILADSRNPHSVQVTALPSPRTVSSLRHGLPWN